MKYGFDNKQNFAEVASAEYQSILKSIIFRGKHPKPQK
jgi:hypothetical protein